MPWKILADAVVILHLLVIGFFIASAVLLPLGIFKGRRNWRIFYSGVTMLTLSLGAASWTRLLTSCSLTDLEYALRRLYDPGESWMRTRSLLGTVICNITGIEVPEFVFTIGAGLAIASMAVSLIARRV